MTPHYTDLIAILRSYASIHRAGGDDSVHLMQAKAFDEAADAIE